MKEQVFSGVYRERSELFTKGKSTEEWNPYHSKPAAAILNGLKKFPFAKGQKILYLGAAHGTTISHLSNILGDKGVIYGIEVSDKIISKFVSKSENRKNVVPLLEDARFPENYGWIGKVDLIYEDIAQRDQVEILKRNKMFLKKGGKIVICLKAKAIDSIREIKEIYKEALEALSKEFEVVETIDLEPYEHDHLFIVGTLK